MTIRAISGAILMSGLLSACAQGQDPTDAASTYKALKCPQPTTGTTWAILEHDGANREVDPYLSSLGQGEPGTGTITSPPFTVDTDKITFTIRGHDGQGGGRGENYIALVDARKGKILVTTEAPGNDALQERSWDVSTFKGVEVRIEVCDGNRGGAFAWVGIGSIDAGPALKVDFCNGMPEGWSRPEREANVRSELVTAGVPFQRNASVYSVIPEKGDVEIPCGFAAKRLFFLGCTVPTGQPLSYYGGIELHYQSGSVDIFPLIFGFTLEGQTKLLSPSKAVYLHRSGDPFQYYLAIAPKNETIEMIRLVSNPARGPIPQLTAITCETPDSNERLSSLPATQLAADEAAWIESHTVTTLSPDLERITSVIRQANQIDVTPKGSAIRFKKRQLDDAFRSEGVAVADLNGDSQLDIAVGNVYYAGPDWKIQPMLGEAREFPEKGYSDAFLCFADDLNRDGATDLVVVGFPGQQTWWLENPASAGKTWQKYLAVEQTGNESPDYLDIDADGQKELLFMKGDRCALARPGKDPRQPWSIAVIAGPNDPGSGHGLGAGDINRDGRLDVLVPNGWWEAPQNRSTVPWKFHQAAFYGGTQMCVWDFDGDGDNDVLSSSAHGYGIAWCEQKPDGWETHMIDERDSQTHAIHLADLNGDGLMDFVTGKRFWAHNGHDPGSFEPAVLCWYELQREQGKPVWIKHEIDRNSGVGLHFQVVDVNGDRRLDIVTSNKKGVYVFEQLPTARPRRN